MEGNSVMQSLASAAERHLNRTVGFLSRLEMDCGLVAYPLSFKGFRWTKALPTLTSLHCRDGSVRPYSSLHSDRHRLEDVHDGWDDQTVIAHRELAGSMYQGDGVAVRLFGSGSRTATVWRHHG